MSSAKTRAARRARTQVNDAATPRPVTDSFQNLQARLGAGAGSVADAGGYVLSNLITRSPRNLEFMYRGSWIVGAAIDAVADDMTRQGVDFGAAIEPDVEAQISAAEDDTRLWVAIGDVIRWARLYGGAIGVMLIDGQDLNTPLRTETVAKGGFKGILPIGRWELNPNVTDLVDEMGPDLGKPKHYIVGDNAPALRRQKIHYSRVIRMEGVRLPYFQRMAEQGWGLSVVERMYDRLLAFDSATTGAAQLVFKAYLRTLKVDGLREILGAGGKAQENLVKNVEAIRQFQTTEGLTMIDSRDTFETYTYAFTGLDDLLLQFGQQLSGATGIPLVRLFGQSPAGLNSTGESDIRNYYDNIKAQQEAMLRSPLNRVLDVLHRSATGEGPPEGFGFDFSPLWQLSETEKAEIAKTTGEAVGAALDDGIITKAVALKELKQSSDTTGIFTNISDEDITEAENEPPELGESDPPDPGAIDPAATAVEPQQEPERPIQLRPRAGAA